MHAITDHLFALPSVHALLQNELEALAPELAGVFGRQGLFVRTHAAAPNQICTPMLGHWVCLHACGKDGLTGHLDCTAQALPFVDDSFRVIVVQHAAERMVDAPAFRAELARVLEPGGLVIVTGFHPLSPWRPWLAWQQRKLIDRATPSFAARWRDELAQAGVQTYAVRRIGAILGTAVKPLARNSAKSRAPMLLAPLRPSYVLLARKQVLGVTPRRVLSLLREPAVRPQLASGSQRGRA